MLLGSHQARIDDKGRLKLPSQFRNLIEGQYGRDLFVTSTHPQGEYVRLYPMKVWNELGAKLTAMPSTERARLRFLQTVGYFGQVAELDNQGRVLVHPRLRASAAMEGEVEVLGQITYLDVWNAARFEAHRQSDPLTDVDLEVLARYGI